MREAVGPQHPIARLAAKRPRCDAVGRTGSRRRVGAGGVGTGMMGHVKNENVWGHGRLWSAVRIGVPTGFLFGAIQFAQTGSLGAALYGGIFFAVFFGGVMAIVLWRLWPGAGDMASTDRVTVARVVRRGEVIDDARLAPAVIDYVDVVRRTQDRDQRYGWMLWAFAGLTLILSLESTLSGSVRRAAVWWALTAFWAGFLVWLPRKRARLLGNAARAEASARQQLEQAPPT